MEFLLLFFGWIFFSYAFAAVVPALVAGTGYLIGYLFLAFWHAGKALLVGLFWLLRLAARLLLQAAQRKARAAPEAPASESAAKDQERAQEERAQEEKPAQAPPRDPYADALARLGLMPGFTQAAFRRAYREAIRTAHPDAGGALADAQAINAARDLVARRHGWK
jgi:hypothetical protein